MIELYHYIHCPFCIRVRLVLGFLDIPCRSIVLPYSDEQTPVKLTGNKMLPIAKIDESIINESLEIIKTIDTGGYFSQPITVQPLLNNLGKLIHSLVMPYWIWTPEFSTKDRTYFKNKKELKRGPFSNLIKNRQALENSLHEELEVIKPHLSPYFKSEMMTINDILLASHLWGLYTLPEFQFPIEFHEYLQKIQSQCSFDNTFQYRSSPC